MNITVVIRVIEAIKVFWSLLIHVCRKLKNRCLLRKEESLIKTAVSVDINLASKIYVRLLSKGF